MNAFPWLSLMTFLPLAGGLIVLAVPKNAARSLALGLSFASLLLAAGLWVAFGAGVKLEEGPSPWIPTLGVHYHLAADGLSLLLVLLAAIIVPMAMLASWKIAERVPLYFALVLFLQAGMFGTFTALNFFHWFIFWELSLIPAFFLIKLWGGPLRTVAATQFFVYTMAGSIAMLLGFLAIFRATHTFDFIALSELGQNGELSAALWDHFWEQLGWSGLSGDRWVMLIFGGVLLGLAVKVPLMPFHTWLPTAYAEAPTGTTMLLTGAMSKMGLYGFLRILLPIFPAEMMRLSTLLLWLAVLTIVCSAAAAFAQRDLKRMLAYSSINHLGYCLLGVFAVMRTGGIATTPMTEKAAALNGVFLQMFNHGITAATLFWFLGLLEERGHGLRGVNDFGGLRKVAPVFCGLMGIALFSSLGLPGLNGFIGEFLIFKGAFPLATWATALSVLGLLLTAVFILTLSQRLFHGPLNQKWATFKDLTLAERLRFVPAIGLMFILGVYPQLVLGTINNTVWQMVQHLRF